MDEFIEEMECDYCGYTGEASEFLSDFEPPTCPECGEEVDVPMPILMEE